MCDLSSQARDWTHTLGSKAWSPNHWTTRGFIQVLFLRLRETLRYPQVCFFHSAGLIGMPSQRANKTVHLKKTNLWRLTPFLQVCAVCVCVQSFSRVRLFATPWTVAHQAPLSLAFCRQNYWSRFPFPSPGDLPDPGTELTVSCVSCRGRRIL